MNKSVRRPMSRRIVVGMLPLAAAVAAVLAAPASADTVKPVPMPVPAIELPALPVLPDVQPAIDPSTFRVGPGDLSDLRVPAAIPVAR